jgi:hypothetical protein
VLVLTVGSAVFFVCELCMHSRSALKPWVRRLLLLHFLAEDLTQAQIHGGPVPAFGQNYVMLGPHAGAQYSTPPRSIV